MFENLICGFRLCLICDLLLLLAVTNVNRNISAFSPKILVNVSEIIICPWHVTFHPSTFQQIPKVHTHTHTHTWTPLALVMLGEKICHKKFFGLHNWREVCFKLPCEMNCRCMKRFQITSWLNKCQVIQMKFRDFKFCFTFEFSFNGIALRFLTVSVRYRLHYGNTITCTEQWLVKVYSCVHFILLPTLTHNSLAQTLLWQERQLLVIKLKSSCHLNWEKVKLFPWFVHVQQNSLTLVKMLKFSNNFLTSIFNPDFCLMDGNLLQNINKFYS